MVTLLHGNNIVASRNKLIEIKQEFKGEIVVFDGKTVSLEKLVQATEGGSLFSENKLIIIENLYSHPLKTQLKTLIDYLINIKTSFEIILWEENELSKTTLKNFPSSWKIKTFSIPKVIFTFVDNLKPGNHKKMLNLLNLARKNGCGDNFIFLMMVRQTRLLLLAKDKTLSSLPSWMMRKLFHQEKNFSKAELLNLYKKLLLTDINQKTGNTPYTLREELDLLLATL